MNYKVFEDDPRITSGQKYPAPRIIQCALMLMNQYFVKIKHIRGREYELYILVPDSNIFADIEREYDLECKDYIGNGGGDEYSGVFVEKV